MNKQETKKLNNYDFSVSMCVYGKDNPLWFRQSVESVLNQTLKPNEIVIVVDGPVPEELNNIITDYEKNPVFSIIRLKENQGHGNARRKGLENCRYELVALMDADDISVCDRFEKQTECFRNNPSLTIVGGYIAEFTNDFSKPRSVREVFENHNDIAEDIKVRCPMNQVTVMFKKSDIESVGGFIDWFCEEDYYLWIRLFEAGFLFANVSQNLVNVRVNDDMYGRRGGWKYFASEKKIQDYMLSKKIINIKTYIINILKRFTVQVLLTNSAREKIFNKYARKSV